jgi:hypothetical protein
VRTVCGRSRAPFATRSRRGYERRSYEEDDELGVAGALDAALPLSFPLLPLLVPLDPLSLLPLSPAFDSEEEDAVSDEEDAVLFESSFFPGFTDE